MSRLAVPGIDGMRRADRRADRCGTCRLFRRCLPIQTPPLQRRGSELRWRFWVPGASWAETSNMVGVSAGGCHRWHRERGDRSRSAVSLLLLASSSLDAKRSEGPGGGATSRGSSGQVRGRRAERLVQAAVTCREGMSGTEVRALPLSDATRFAALTKPPSPPEGRGRRDLLASPLSSPGGRRRSRCR